MLIIFFSGEWEFVSEPMPPVSGEQSGEPTLSINLSFSITLTFVDGTWTKLMYTYVPEENRGPAWTDEPIEWSDTFTYENGVITLMSEYDFLRLGAEITAYQMLTNDTNVPDDLYEFWGTETSTLEQMVDWIMTNMAGHPQPTMTATHCAITDTLTLRNTLAGDKTFVFTRIR